MKNIKFSFENLEVWRKSVGFSKMVIELTEKIETNRKHFRLIEQLESSSSSVPMNIAEGTGRYSRREFIQFLYISRGSLYETVTLLTLAHELRWIDDSQLAEIKSSAVEIAKMLSSLITSLKRSLT
jgi:four helix bundle protein